jgi:hypothetical protein
VPYTSRPPGFTSEAGRVEDRALLGVQLGEPRLGLPRLEVGIAPQRAEARARRIHEHAVDLAAQALHLRVVLVGDALREDVRQARALEARSEVREAAVGDVEGVEPPCEFIAAPICSVLPPAPAQKSTTISPRRGSTRSPQDLAAFVLTSTAPSRNIGCLLSAGFSFRRTPSGEYARGRRGELVVRESIEDRLARRLHRIHAQVERRRLLEPAGEREDLLVTHGLAKPRDDPVGKVCADLEGLRVQVLGLECREPGLLAVLEHRFDLPEAHALELHDRRERHFARGRMRRHFLEEAPAPERGVHRVGHEPAVAAPEVLVVAEELAQLLVRRARAPAAPP